MRWLCSETAFILRGHKFTCRPVCELQQSFWLDHCGWKQSRAGCGCPEGCRHTSRHSTHWWTRLSLLLWGEAADLENKKKIGEIRQEIVFSKNAEGLVLILIKGTQAPTVKARSAISQKGRPHYALDACLNKCLFRQRCEKKKKKHSIFLTLPFFLHMYQK